jgi:ATP-dependent RNA helicase SUPV3L1/SUV3
MLSHYVGNHTINNEPIDERSDNIDYLETSIKCVELYQWLSRHFDNKNFVFDEKALLENKSKAIERLNELLSDKIGKTCSSCGCKMPANARFNICDDCFSNRKFNRRGPAPRSDQGQRADQGRGPDKRDDRKRDGGRKHEGPRRSEKSDAGAKKHAGSSSQHKKPSQGGAKSSSGSSSGSSGGGGIKKPSGAPKKNAAAAFRKHR